MPGLNVAVADGSRSIAGSLTLAALGQTLSGSFGFDQKVDSSGNKETTVTFQGVSLDLGGGLVHVSDGQGLFVLNSAGLAGTASASITSTVASFGGTFSIAINTSAAPLNVTIGTRTINVPGGPYVRVAGSGVTLALPGPSGSSPATLAGDFALESITINNANLVKIAATNVTVALGDGSGTDFADVTGGEAFLVVSSSGVAASSPGRSSRACRTLPSPAASR